MLPTLGALSSPGGGVPAQTLGGQPPGDASGMLSLPGLPQLMLRGAPRPGVSAGVRVRSPRLILGSSELQPLTWEPGVPLLCPSAFIAGGRCGHCRPL